MPEKASRAHKIHRPEAPSMQQLGIQRRENEKDGLARLTVFIAQQVVLVRVSYLALIHWRQNKDVPKALYQLWVSCSRCVAGSMKFNHRMLGASAKACVANVVGWI